MTYEYWEKALADPKALHAREFSITTTPEPGFYRTYRMLEPVAIWEEDGKIVIHVNGEEVWENEHERVWLSAAKNPISEEWYRAVVEGGQTWPDLDEAVAGIGHNRRKADDPESLIDDLTTQAETYKSIDSDEMSQRALSLRSAILELHGRVDKQREEAKAPFLKSAREVDEIYMPMVKRAKKWADYLRTMVEAYETRKRKLAREAEVARAASEALKEAVADRTLVPEPLNQIRTGYGRAVSVQTKLRVTSISDPQALFDYLIRSQTLAFREVLIDLAQKDVNAGITVPGVTVEEQAVLR